MRQILLVLLPLLVGACSPAATDPAVGVEEDSVASGEIIVFGYVAGHGNDGYLRLRNGQLYRSAYAGLRSNDPANRLNRDALATEESNWELVGPTPADLAELYADLPRERLLAIGDRNQCAALAYDGSCGYLGLYQTEGDRYDDWLGEFEGAPKEVGTYLTRVQKIVQSYGE